MVVLHSTLPSETGWETLVSVERDRHTERSSGQTGPSHRQTHHTDRPITQRGVKRHAWGMWQLWRRKYWAQEIWWGIKRPGGVSRDLVGYQDVTMLVPHAVSVLLLEQKTSQLSPARCLRDHMILWGLHTIKVQQCNVLSAATLRPTEEDGEPHDCAEVVNVACTPWYGSLCTSFCIKGYRKRALKRQEQCTLVCPRGGIGEERESACCTVKESHYRFWVQHSPCVAAVTSQLCVVVVSCCSGIIVG